MINVTKRAVRELIREALGPVGYNDLMRMPTEEPKNPIEPTATVDKSEAVTVLGDDEFRPQDRTELRVALANLATNTPEDIIPNIYDVIKNAYNDVIQDEDDENPEDVKTMKADTTKTKTIALESLRKLIRRQILEAGLSSSGLGDTSGALSSEEDEENEKPLAPLRRTVTGPIISEEEAMDYRDVYEQSYAELLEMEEFDDEDPETLFRYVTETETFKKNFKEKTGEDWRLYAIKLGRLIKGSFVAGKVYTSNKDDAGDEKSANLLKDVAKALNISTSDATNVDHVTLAKAALGIRSGLTMDEKLPPIDIDTMEG